MGCLRLKGVPIHPPELRNSHDIVVTEGPVGVPDPLDLGCVLNLRNVGAGQDDIATRIFVFQ